MDRDHLHILHGFASPADAAASASSPLIPSALASTSSAFKKT
jgi:hypothetical protein